MSEEEDKEYLHTRTQEIVCPYCYEAFTDSWDHSISDHTVELECYNEKCGKNFEVCGEPEYYYYSNRMKDD